MIYQRKKQIKDTDHDQFVQDSLGILALFQRGEEALDERPDLRRQTRPEDMTATAQRMGGVVGSMLQRQLNEIRFTHTQLEEFVASVLPRDIPGGLKRQVVGQLIPVIVFGIAIGCMGTIFSGILWFAAAGTERYIAIPLLLAPIIGGTMVFQIDPVQGSWASQRVC